MINIRSYGAEGIGAAFRDVDKSSSIGKIIIRIIRFYRLRRRGAATGQGVSAQLPRHGGFGPPHRLGDGADRTASGLQRSDLISFVIQQMRIAWHGNTPEGLDQPSR